MHTEAARRLVGVFAVLSSWLSLSQERRERRETSTNSDPQIQEISQNTDTNDFAPNSHESNLHGGDTSTLETKDFPHAETAEQKSDRSQRLSVASTIEVEEEVSVEKFRGGG